MIKAVNLLSNGIDSPVAAHLMKEARADVTLLNLDLRPFTDDKTIEITDDLVKSLVDIHPDIDAYRADFGLVQKALADSSFTHSRCLICRDLMYRAGEKLADKIGRDVISTGENLGQVASQTLSNLRTLDGSVDMDILRPLIGLDKNEIISIAREIGTFEISARGGVCCLLTPSGPKIKSEKRGLKEIEERLNLEELLDKIEFYKI